MPKRAIRLHNILDDLSNIDAGKGHIDHMYSGQLSRYYYRRFDQALRLAEIGSSDRVLQIGGGTGVFSLSLAEYANNVHFTDVKQYVDFDAVQQLLRKIKCEKKVDLVSTDATTLCYKDNTFDKVFAMDVLEHISDEERAIAEISRVLRREGKLIVSAPVEIGIPLFVREAYRFFDGDRRQTKTILELLKGIAKSPYCEKVGHRGYDYRRTIEFVDNHFEITSMEFCPLPIFRELNPTVIFIATN